MPADIISVANTWIRVAKGVKAGGSGLCINGTLSNATTGTANTKAAGGGKGGAPSNDKGGAGVVEASNLGRIALLVLSGSVATVLL